MITDKIIPQELQDRVENELGQEERVEWMDMPRARLFAGGSLGIVLFGIPWTAFAVFWMCGAAGFQMPDFKDGGDFFVLFGIPFVLVGLGMLTSPYWMYRKMLRTVYVITDRRAILFVGGRTTTIRSFGPEQLGQVYRRERKNGYGDVVIGRSTWEDSDDKRRSREFGFFGVRNAKEVEEMLRELAEKAQVKDR